MTPPSQIRPPSQLMRGNIRLIDEIEEIRQERLSEGLQKLSYSKITSLIIRHKNWKVIKKAIINYEEEEDDE